MQVKITSNLNKQIKFDCSSMDIISISNNVLGEASQAMDPGVYLVQCVRCPTVSSSGVLVGNAGFHFLILVQHNGDVSPQM